MVGVEKKSPTTLGDIYHLVLRWSNHVHLDSVDCQSKLEMGSSRAGVLDSYIFSGLAPKTVGKKSLNFPEICH
jgi:hypothetical protein